jgi:hypothetical protein
MAGASHRRAIIDLLAIDFQLSKVCVKGPVVDAVETLIPELRSLYGAIRIPRVANIDRPLNTLKGVSVRTEKILEESYPVAAHRRRGLPTDRPPIPCTQ